MNICVKEFRIALCIYLPHGYAFGCVGLCNVCQQIKLSSALLLKNLLLSVFYYFLTEFKHLQYGCYVQQAVQIEQFMLFQIICGGPSLAPK